jgi:hypothetical protein
MGALKWIIHIIRNESKLLVADRCLRWPHCARTVSLAAKGVPGGVLAMTGAEREGHAILEGRLF